MRKWISCGVAVAMLITSFFGIEFVDNSKKTQAASAGGVIYELKGNGLYGAVVCRGEDSTEEEDIFIADKKYSSSGDEFYEEEADEFGDMLNEQMVAYLNGDSGAAVVEKISEKEDPSSYITLGMCSKATFSMYSLGMEVSPSGEDGETILRYVFQSLAEHTNLCPFFTAINYSYRTVGGKCYLSNFTVYSPLSVSEIKSAVATYNYCFQRLVKVPSEDTDMTEAEKLLYIHDEIVSMTEYAMDDDCLNHIPMAAAVYGEAVCQSYAAIMNQAATYLGIETLYVNSDTHAWNAVKLDGFWYYIDATWDDPTNRDRNFIHHKYFLVQEDDFDSDHIMDTEYTSVYETIPENMGHAYDNYFPKENNITSQMCYSNGMWYYTDNNTLYAWDGESGSGQEFNEITEDAYRECVAFDGILYYSGSDGVYQYQEEGEDICLSSVPAKGLNMADGILYYLTESGDWTSIQIREPDPTPTPTPTASPTPSPTPTAEPTEEPTPAPTAIVNPTVEPTEEPTPAPTATPTLEPTEEPTMAPTATPTVAPTKEPTPTVAPTAEPTPTVASTEEPTPTVQPTVEPTQPEGKIICEENIWETLLSVITFGLYKPSGTKVTITSNVEKISYYIDQTGRATALTEMELSEKEFCEYTEPFEMPEGSVVVYAKLENEVGQIKYLCSDGIVVQVEATPTAAPMEEPTATPEPTPTEGDGPTLPPASTMEPTENPGGSQIKTKKLP